MRVEARKTRRNWVANLTWRPERTLYPTSTEEVAQIVRKAAAQGRRVRPVGAAYSYTPLAQTDQDQVSLEAMAGVESVDLERGIAVVRAGTRLSHLVKELAAQGAAIANMGDIDQQGLAGAIATGTHGTGVTIPSLSSQVVALTLVNGLGEVLELDSNSPLFPSAQISLGALGIITSVTLRVQPRYSLRIERGAEPFDQLLPTLQEQAASNRNFEFFWFPGDRLAYTKTMNETPGIARLKLASELTRAVTDIVVENGLMWLACESVKRWPDLRQPWLRLGESVMASDTAIRPADHAYATPRIVRHFEVEYALPADRAADALAALAEALRQHPVSTLVPVEVRFAAAEDIPLSPAYGQAVVWIAAHAYKGEAYQEYFDRCEQLFLSFDGRPHWGKLHSLVSRQLEGKYLRWNEFQAARRTLDPNQVFANDYLNSVLGAVG